MYAASNSQRFDVEQKSDIVVLIVGMSSDARQLAYARPMDKQCHLS